MKLKLIALASAAVIGLTAVATPDQAEARWRRGGWWIPGGRCVGCDGVTREFARGIARRQQTAALNAGPFRPIAYYKFRRETIAECAARLGFLIWVRDWRAIAITPI